MAYLRDKDGNIVRDPVTGEGRRIDFVVIKDGKVVCRAFQRLRFLNNQTEPFPLVIAEQRIM